MRLILRIFCAILLSSCAQQHKYPLANPVEASVAGGVVRVWFKSSIVVIDIDAKPFRSKGFSAMDTHEVTLPAGVHTFRVRYDGNDHGPAMQSIGDAVLRRDLLPGKRYEIRTRYYRSGKVYFHLLEENEFVL